MNLYLHFPLKKIGLWIARLITLLLIFFSQSSVSSADQTYSIYLPTIANPCPLVNIPSSGNWLIYLNYYRATACLPPLIENEVWSNGDFKHATYIVKNNILQHDEDPNNPWYTPEGRTAAQQSNLAGSYNENATDMWAIDTWMQAPFHAVGILDPQLTQVGYGSYRENASGLRMGAALNVIAGLNYSTESNYPIIWPGNGMTVPINLHWGETPSPLTSCPNYTAPSGLPVIMQFGSGSASSTPIVSATSFMQNGQALEHCVFNETTYTNPDSASQNLGRSILGMRNAVVLIPRYPLTPELTYTVSITVNGQSYTWSFNVK